MVAPLQNKASAQGQSGPPQRGSTSVSKAKPKETLRERVAKRDEGPKSGAEARLQESEQTNRDIDELEANVAELKAKYDQYFLGMERFEPIKEREALKKRIVALKSSFIRNAGVKFRVGSIHQKFLSYERMWQRIAREIEEGTYQRDLFKAKRRKEAKEKKQKKAEAFDLSAEQGEEREEKTDPHAVVPQELGDVMAAALKAVEGRAAEAKAPRAPPPPPAADAPASSAGTPLPPPPPGSKAPPVPPPVGARPPPPPGMPPMPTPPPFMGVSARPPPPPGADRPVSATPTGRPPPPPGGTPLPSGTPARPTTTMGGGPSSRPPPPPGGASRPPPPPGGGSSGGDEARVKQIYAAYMAAKRQCRESTDGITLDSVAQTIRSQTPELMKQHSAKSVDFKVVIKNGKASLKAIPKT